MSVKKSQSQFSLKSCGNKKNDRALNDTTAKMLYQLAFTVWHVSFHIENKLQVFSMHFLSLTLEQLTIFYLEKPHQIIAVTRKLGLL